MNRKTLSGVVTAATILAAGAWAVVQAQDDTGHDHAHGPTSVHSADGTHFLLDDPAAYPDPDGFESMEGRVSYVIGRLDGLQLPENLDEVDAAAYEEGIRAGLNEVSDDRAAGYELGRSILKSQPETDIDAMIEGIRQAAAEDSFSRAMGTLVGNGYRNRDISILPEVYMQGVAQTLARLEAEGAEGETPATTLGDEQLSETAAAFRHLMVQRDLAAQFTEFAPEQEGWVTTDSGLRYRVIEQGEGASPNASDKVTCHYEGKLMDGTVFDSSFQRGDPAVFGLNQVIPGWTEGVQLMKVGSTFEFLIPPDLAYGAGGVPQAGIGPNAILRFKVSLFEIEGVAADDREPLGD